jgi:simple sugar transport system permease protein
MTNPTTDIEPKPEMVKPRKKFKYLELRHNSDGNMLRLLLMTVSILIILSLLRPDKFPTLQNFRSMGFQMSEIGVLAIAIMLTMLTGGIDLSVNANANLTGILAGLILTKFGAGAASPFQIALSMGFAIAVALAVGTLCGLLNGLLVAKVGIPPILATLGTMTLFTGFAFVLTKGSGVFGIPAFQYIGNGEFQGIPVPLIIFAVAAVLMGVVMNRSAYGMRVYLLGTNPLASLFSGINNSGILIRTYAISGFLSSIAGIIILARTNSANPDYGSSYVLQAILIAVLGGINPSGGFGKISGIVLAMISLQFLSTGLNMLLFQFSGSNFFKEFAWGALLILIMIVNYISSKRNLRSTVIKG